LIASRESASFGDFKETLSSSAYGFLLYLAETRVQGSRTEHSVVRSLEKLQSLELDLIVLVRGGGSQTELAYLDNERIARAIAFCRYPVWTGIGHETDTSVLDVVAARSFRTPTAAAEELLTRFQKVDSFLAEAGQRLRINAGFRLAPLRENLEGTIESFRRSSFGMLLTQKQTVDSSRALFSSSAKATVRHWNQKLDQWETMIRTEPLRLLESQKRQRRHLADRFTTTTLGTLKQWRQKVEHVQQSLRAQAPRRMASEKGCLEAGQSELLKSVGRLLSSHRELLACGCEQLEPDRTLRSLVRHRIQVQQLHEMLSRSSSRSLMTATAALQSERRRFQLERYLRLLTESQARLEAWLSVVKANDPQNALSRGYALLHDRHGRFITRLDEVRLDELYTVRLGDGEFDARAEEKRENE
jgi:exodeoxyribonuclease VII large subunit